MLTMESTSVSIPEHFYPCGKVLYCRVLSKREGKESDIMKYFRIAADVLFFTLIAVVLVAPVPAGAANAGEINGRVTKALNHLYATTPSAKALGEKAKGILVFPKIVKGGFMVGGQYGEGALRKNGKTVGYYSSAAMSYGLQVGIEKFGYAMFFMTDSAMKWLDKSGGWEIGSGSGIVVIDEGIASKLSTTMARSD